MPADSNFLIPQMIFTIGVLVYAGRLIQLRLKGSKRDVILRKHKLDARAYEFYQMVYSERFLVIWSLFAFSQLLDLAIDLYKRSHSHFPLPILTASLTLSLVISTIIFYQLFTTFKRK